MRRTTQLVFSVPPAMIKEVESLARKERRTKSELFREMVRIYDRYRVQRERDEQRWVAGLIAEAKIEQTQQPMSAKEMLAEDDRLARYGARRARHSNTTPGDIDRIIHERRKARQA